MLSIACPPQLPGMQLLDPSTDCLQGQVFYLDLDGAQNVDYNGPVKIQGIDVPAFKAAGPLVGQEHAIISAVLADLQTTFTGSGVRFTTSKPDGRVPYSTVYVGGTDSRFVSYGSFLGLAEEVDAGNRNRSDKAFIFSDKLAPTTNLPDAALALVQVIAHESGHLLGYAHNESGSPATAGGLLESVAEDDYPYANTTPDSVDPWNFYTRECTSYVAWRMNRDAGSTAAPYWFTNGSVDGVPGHWGNAENWDSNAATLGFTVDTVPQVGDIAQWNPNEGGAGAAGHVAYIEQVNGDGSVNISEYNWTTSFGYDVRNNVHPPRFIHVKKFSSGDRVQTTGSLNVRATPGGTAQGSEATGRAGTIVGGPTGAAMGGTFYKWYNVNWDDGVSGWSVEPFMTISTTTTPTITSVNPASPLASASAQTLTIYGNSFQTGCTVTLRNVSLGTTYPNQSISSQTAKKIVINPTLGTTVNNWSVEVINPGNASSGQFPFSTQAVVFGVDVYQGDGTINWNTVHGSGGIAFAIIKATQGTSYGPTYFANNAPKAIAAGLSVGAYHYADPDANATLKADPSNTTNLLADADAEADYFVKIAGAYLTPGNLQPSLDLEPDGGYGGIGSSFTFTQIATWANEWVARVKRDVPGVQLTPIIYINQNYAGNLVGISPSLTSNFLWIADYNNNPAATPTTGPWPNWGIMQYGGGSVPGITGSVDLDALSPFNTLDSLKIPLPDLTVTLSHSGNFKQRDNADTYTITVSNVGPSATSGAVTVRDTLPTGLTPTVADNGTINGWSVSTSGQTVTATRSDTLAAGASYPSLTVTVSVARTAAATVTNTVIVSGGGQSNTANDTASDLTTISPVYSIWTGGGSDNKWQTAANWGAAPAANDLLYFGGSNGLSNTNDSANNTQFNGITFNAAAGPFVLGGNTIRLNGDLTNNSTSPQTIALAMLLVGQNRTINASTGDFSITGNIGESGGGYGIIKTGTGKLTLSGRNTYSGGTTVLSGTLVVSSAAALPAGGSLCVGVGSATIFGPATSSPASPLGSAPTLDFVKTSLATKSIGIKTSLMYPAPNLAQQRSLSSQVLIGSPR